MKSKKAIQIRSILFSLVGNALLIFALSSCDVLKTDQDLQKNNVEVKDKQIYVRNNSSVIIDLNSKIKTNQIVTLSINSSTKYGSMTEMGKGMIQYSPNQGTTRDAFGFTVYDKNNKVVKQDSVVIIIEQDSTNLPCGIYPANDYISNVVVGTPITINVLANDIICKYNTSEIEISIYRPEQNFAPYFGTAEVVGNNVIYQPGSSFKGNDKFIYKIQYKTDTSITAYGIVYINGITQCEPSLLNDYYGFQLDSLTQQNSDLQLPVFSNDIFCDTNLSNYQYSIPLNPLYGSATINSQGIIYKPNDIVRGQLRTDSLRYQVCINNKCIQTSLIIAVKK